ncbi:NADH-quinone oxidoreductase subunit L [Planctellipticum variicoloris]|uniref:NADH-quinone oxidoreductase subunit L n=1 Tax=Planctellipticum variicoloris TaxID=3064265 RepID=UPI003013FDF3|nr:NADH-quinone oxidoreductase subunit L [Planctomycetaceae bacterium SH412]
MTTNPEQLVPLLLTAAWLLPLAGCVVEFFALRWTHRLSKAPAWVAVGCIAAGFLCSAAAAAVWSSDVLNVDIRSVDDGGVEDHRDIPLVRHIHSTYSGTYYELARFGERVLSIDYHIDGLTLLMFCMVTFVATCIHVFSIGYMADELTEEYLDHRVELQDGRELGRPGRFHQFFAYLSLFSFSMLGLLLSGNLLQVFAFWELVGICSYLLIGFHYERVSATTAANKAFIMNRIGDFGFLIGLMIVWTYLGSFQFYDQPGRDGEPGIFGRLQKDGETLCLTEDGQSVMLRVAAGTDEPHSIPLALLAAAGLGIFAGCVGKSAQFPLHTWLPDAMEGPTPVSALVHSATMVAAGVYLTARCYPLFTPEVLLVVAYTGAVTLVIGATIAIVSYDIKRVLAFSTISQLGYMLLGLGVGGWKAGVFHLVTHAGFKALLFLCAGSVIVGTHHTQDVQKLGGLRKAMPLTALCMLIGVIAISGLAVPLISFFGEPIAFSGYHSKDAILGAALAFSERNAWHGALFLAPLITAGLTACYMFRLWLLMFWGEPRDRHVAEHAEESPLSITVPLLVLAFVAATIAIGGEHGPLYGWLSTAEQQAVVVREGGLRHPTEEELHAAHDSAGRLALLAAFAGAGLAWLFYGNRFLNAAEVRRTAGPVYDFLIDKWRFDALYDAVFVQPTHVVARWCLWFDRRILDAVLHGAAMGAIAAARVDRRIDETFVDGAVNRVGWSAWVSSGAFGALQTGRLRQYILFLAMAVVVLFAVAYTAFPK